MKNDWFKNWFDTTYYHILYQNRDEKEAQVFIQNLLQHLTVGNNKRLLDIACGKGRHALHMHQMGHQVTGYDLSKQSIIEAKKKESPGLSFFEHDMRHIFRVNYFDYAFNLFTSFGYFDNSRDEQNAILSANKSLKPGGKFVIDFLNRSKVINELVPEETKIVNGLTFQIKRFIEADKIHKQISFEVNGARQEYTEKVKLLALSDFEKYFNTAGLKITETFGNYNLAPHDDQANRLIIIGSKK